MRTLLLSALALALLLTSTAETASAQVSCTTTRTGDYAFTTCSDPYGGYGSATTINSGSSSFTNGYYYPPAPLYPQYGGYDCYDPYTLRRARC